MAIVVAVVALGGGIALAAVFAGGDKPTEPRPRPGTAPLTTAPSSTVRAPPHNPQQSPPWGFTGGGWPDVCYGPVATPGARKQQPASDAQPCRPGSRRITALTQIALTARAGADVNRLQAIWSAIEPLPPSQAAARGLPRFNWAPLVRRYHAMLRNGIRPIVVAYGSPAWARSRQEHRPKVCGPSGGGCSYRPEPRRIPQWQAFLRGLMVHLPKMKALEIWNEPNHPKFFAPRPAPGLYARLLTAANHAAREAGFHRPIISGGLAPIPSGGGRVPPPQFLSRVYEVAGKKAFDGIGAHPYPGGPPWTDKMTADLDRLRTVSARFDDGSKPLWITEVGLGGIPGGAGRFNVSADRQGPVLARMYRAARELKVRSFLIYTLYDSGLPDTRFGTYGVLDPALRPKPAYCYLTRHVGGRRTCPRTSPWAGPSN
jgi:hypothetical protein